MSEPIRVKITTVSGQTTYAYMSQETLDSVPEALGDPTLAKSVMSIDSALAPGGPYLPRVYRWGQITDISRDN